MNNIAGKKILRELREIIYARKESAEEAQPYKSGMDLFINEDFERAIAAFCKAIEMQPDFAFSYYYLGRCFKRIEKFQEAIIALEKAIELNPLHAPAYAYLGNVFLCVNKFAEADKYFRDALNLQFDNQTALCGLVKLAKKTNSNFDEMAKLLKDGYFRGKKNPLLLMELFSFQRAEPQFCLHIAKDLVAQKSFHRAIFFYRLALRGNPKDKTIQSKIDEILEALNYQ